IPVVIECDVEAGYAVGPFDFGIYRFFILNPNCHKGMCGKFSCYQVHTNLEFQIKNPTGSREPYGDVFNFHIFRYESGGKDCLYVYENKQYKGQVFDECNDFPDLRKKL